MKQLYGHKHFIRCLEVIEEPKSNTFLLVSGSEDETIRLWDLNSLECTKTFLAHAKGVLCLTYLPIQKLMLSGGKDGRLKLWEILKGICIRNLIEDGPEITCLCSMPNMEIFASGDSLSNVHFWRIDKLGNTKFISSCQTEQSKIFALGYAGDGKTFFSGGADKKIKIWAIDELPLVKNVQILSGHEDTVSSIILFDKTMVSGSWDKKIRVWDLRPLLKVPSIP